MGNNSGKQNGHKENHQRRASFRRILRGSSRRTNETARPVSYAGINQCYDEHQTSTRPMSMVNVIAINHLEIKTSLDMSNPLSRSSSQSISTNESSERDQEDHLPQTISNKFEDNQWQFYIPLTLEKLRTIAILKDIIDQSINTEFSYILNRLLRLENTDEHEEFLQWFFDELEYNMQAVDDDATYSHKSLLLRSIEQDRYDCTKYFLEHQLLSSKLDINTINDQGRHCLLMLSHKNGPVDLIKRLLTHHVACLDRNKIDLNNSSAFHHVCRHFNLSLCELLLPHTNKHVLQIENSELHTPLDYWMECLYSLKKLKPTHIQHGINSLRLDHLLDNRSFHSYIVVLQTIINRGGQLSKLPSRYIRSILSQYTYEQKLSYVDHHVDLCCILYKNRLSTLLHNYDPCKVSIQASDILTEFIYALGSIQVEIQTRQAENACSTQDHWMKMKEYELLQSTMRMLYGKFFSLFECIYNNSDVNVKSFHFENIFRHVWIYWKEPVNGFIKQSRERNLLLKSICRKKLFQCLNHYPGDILNLQIHPLLKQFLSFNNRFFVVPRKVSFQ